MSVKIGITQTRIIEWYEHYKGKVYISFSGGKDSTVLLDLARRIYPNIEAVYVDTGLEYPEIRDFVKTKENVTWLKPEITFNKVIEKYGYPIISKDISEKVKLNRSKPDGCTKDMFEGVGQYQNSFYNLSKYKYLIDAPFKISDSCCDVMKKRPLKKFQKESGKFPIIGTMAYESRQRKNKWLQQGCNGFAMKSPISQPLSFWTEQDVLTYLKDFNIPYCPIYGDIETKKDKLKMTGEQRTGCMFCMFGINSDKSPNRFQRMKETHPKQYDYCINKLGLGKVLDYIGVPY